MTHPLPATHWTITPTNITSSIPIYELKPQWVLRPGWGFWHESEDRYPSVTNPSEEP